MRTWPLVLIPLALLGGCGTDAAEMDAAPESACVQAFADAAEVPDTQDTHADLWPAFDACGSLEEFAAASEEHPDALDGTDPAIAVQNQCEYEPEVADSALCRSL